MKVRLFFIVCTLLLGCGSLWAQDFFAENKEGKTLYYNIITGTNNVEVTFNKNNNYEFESIEIPAQVVYNGKTYTVTEIGEKAFYPFGFKKSKLMRVTLPNTIKVINADAFRFSYSGQHVFNFPASLEIIGDQALWGLDMDKLILNDGLKSIGSKTFFGAPFLEISVPSTVQEIGKNAFAGNKNRVHNGVGNYTGYISNMPSYVGVGNAGIFGLSKESVQTYLTNRTMNQQQPQVIYVQAPLVQQTSPQQQTVPTIESVKAPSSDVDTNLPDGAANNSNTFAVIIANEDYQEEVKVEYAQNDGEIFRQYCQKVLGMPEKNIHIRKNATLNNFKAELSWMKQVANAFNGDASFIVYYAGHGVPDEATRVAYLLPVDGKGTMLETGYSLEEFYQTLGAMPAKSITVFMDACFSGSKRGEGMLTAARGVVIEAEPGEPQGNMVVFSAAQGNETAYPYHEKEHGLFTYFLLKKLKETNGNVSLGELSSYITQQVSRESIVTNGKSQTPSVNVSSQIGDAWKAMKLK